MYLTINRYSNGQGLFGYVGEGAEIKNVQLEDINVSGRDYTGGLAGFVYKAEICRSYTTGFVSGQHSTGGLIGYHDGKGSLSIVRESFSTASVVGTDSVGGLVGNNFDGATIYDSYATGQVESNNFLGGIVGRNNAASVNDSYSTGLVRRVGSSTHDSMGGLIGFVNSLSVVEGSFWDTHTSEQTTSKGGTGKTTPEMTKRNTFESWDFDIWAIDEDVTYPYLLNNQQDPKPVPPAPFAGGSGTETDPYKVATAEQLNQVRNYLDKHFIQIADIDLGVAPWNVDEGWEPIRRFSGMFDGNGYEIQNLFIHRLGSSGIGLFEEITLEGQVENMNLISGNVIGRDYVGGIAGLMNSWSDGNKLYRAHVIDSYSTGNVTGHDGVGAD